MNISKFRGLVLPLMMTFSSFSAFGQEAGNTWRRVSFLDFGGNSETDPIMRKQALYDFEGQTSIEFAGALVSPATKYSIGKYPQASNPANWIVGGGDHTYSDNKDRGYYLMLNCPAPYNPNSLSKTLDYPREYIYQKTLTQVCPGIVFKFEAYVANLLKNDNNSSGSAISLGIYDGSDNKLWELESFEVRSGRLVDQALDWKLVSGEFAVPSNANLDELNFKIYPMKDGVPGSETNGFDFGLDDIAIYVQQPTVSFDHSEFYFKDPATITATLGSTSFFADMNNVVYTWEYSQDGETGWTKVGSGSYKTSHDFAYNIESFDKDNTTGSGNGYYRLTLANEGVEVTDATVCCVREIFQIDEKLSKLHLVICEADQQVIDGTTFTKADDGTTKKTAGGNFEVVTEVLFNKIIDEETKICKDSEFPVGSGKVYSEIGKYVLNSEVTNSTVTNYSGEYCPVETKNITLNVTEGDVDSLDYEHICQGRASMAGDIYDEVGTFYKDDKLGCLTQVHTIVVHPSYYNLEAEETICQGSVYRGETRNIPGDFQLSEDKFKTNLFGCDSFVTVLLHVTSFLEETLPDVEICQSEFGAGVTAFEFDGKKYVNDTKKDMVLDLESVSTSKVTGCDSITKQHVVIHPIINVTRDTLVCLDQIVFGKEWTVAGDWTHEEKYFRPSCGCSKQDSIVTWNVKVIDVQLKLRAEFDATQVCEGQSATLIVDLIPSDVPLTWEPDLTSRNPLRPVVSPETSTMYVAHAKNNVGCHATDSIFISVVPAPSLSVDTVMNMERKIYYSVTGGTPDFKYFVGTRELTEDNFPEPGVINGFAYGKDQTLKVIDANGCAATDTFSVEPTPIKPLIYFSPNHDNISDGWEIEGIDAYPDAVVRIFTRFGRLVFEAKDYGTVNFFDGTYNGNPLPSTDYWYVIDIESIDRQFMGHFTLLR